MTETQSAGGLRLLLILFGIWLLMRSVNADQTGRTLVDYLLGNKASKSPYLQATISTASTPQAALASSTGAASPSSGGLANVKSGTLSKQQIEQLWIANGGNPSQANTAAAVALAESSGNTSALGDQGNSHGLWQVYIPAHPQYSASGLNDPNYNAKAAISISGNGSNWGPWSTFNSGAYRQFL